MFADNNYVGYTAWPGMFMTVSDGWLGIVPNGKRASAYAQFGFLAC